MKNRSKEVQRRVSLVFATFLQLGSVGKVLRCFRDHALTVFRRDRFGDAVWRTPTVGMLTGILKNPAYAGAFVCGRTLSCHSTYANGKLITARCPMAGPQAGYVHRPAPCRPTACPRIDLALLCRSEGISPAGVLDRLLARLYANKAELLMVLQRPEIPLHNNGAENDIRCQVTRRKISAGTRSDLGRDCRDAFLGLSKTCAKLGLAFWDYLGSRLAVPGHHAIPTLPTLVRCREKPA
jgi:hypothetical protein